MCLAAGTGCAGPLCSVIVHLNLLVMGCLLPGESICHLFAFLPQNSLAALVDLHPDRLFLEYLSGVPS